MPMLQQHLRTGLAFQQTLLLPGWQMVMKRLDKCVFYYVLFAAEVIISF